MTAIRSDATPLSHPTVAEPTPKPTTKRTHVPCGNCVHWHHQGGARSPFGQCLLARQFLGASLFTTDIQSCSQGKLAQ